MGPSCSEGAGLEQAEPSTPRPPFHVCSPHPGSGWGLPSPTDAPNSPFPGQDGHQVRASLGRANLGLQEAWAVAGPPTPYPPPQSCEASSGEDTLIPVEQMGKMRLGLFQETLVGGRDRRGMGPGSCLVQSLWEEQPLAGGSLFWRRRRQAPVGARGRLRHGSAPPPPPCPAWGPPDKPDPAHHPAGSLLHLWGVRGSRGLHPGQMEG